MQRIANGTQLASLPSLDATSGTPGYFGRTADGLPAPTRVGRDWHNMVQEEIMAVLAAAGVSPSSSSFNQLVTAIQILIGASGGYADDTGAANAYIIAPTIAISAYAEGQTFRFKAAHANTGASTLNVSGQGAKAITRRDGTALQAGDIPALSECMVIYDGTEFQLIAASTPASATTSVAGIVALATGAQAIAGTDTSHAVTPAAMLSAFAQSLGTSGYITYPGGLIIQWMSLSSVPSASNAETFPTSFPNACWGLVLCPVAPYGIGGGQLQDGYTSLSKTGFNLNNSSSNTRSYFVIAIGN